MDYRKILVALSLVAAGASAQAKTLQEILKDKGVITDAEAQEAAQPVVSYKPADGFTLMTPDQNWKLTLGGRIQANYAYTGVENQKERVGVSQDVSSFRIRRGYMWLKGNAFTKDVTYKLQVDFASSFPLLDAWLNYKLMDEVQVEAGQDIVPFARQELNSSATLQFIERSIVVDYYKPSYDTGVMVWGKLANGLAYYNLGAFNGQGANQLRTTPNTALNVRAVVNPLGDFSNTETDVDFTQNPLLSVGTSYFMNKVAYGANADALTGSNYQKNFLKPLAGVPGVDGSTPPVTLVQDTVAVGLWEVDAAFRWMGLYVQAEYFMGSAQAAKTVNTADGALGNKDAKVKLKSSGYYAQAGYTVLPKTLELAVRYGAYDPNTSSFTTATNTATKHDKRTEISGAVNYYLYKHGLKLQAELSSQGREEKSLAVGAAATDYKKLNNLIGRVQAQVIF